MLRYKKLEKIGHGAYGDVYKSLDNQTNTIVALKKMKLEVENEGVPSTVIRETSLLRELNHPNVISLNDIVVDNKKLFLVFESSFSFLSNHLNFPFLGKS